MRLVSAVRRQLAPYAPTSIAYRRRRRLLAERYLVGDGVEIGALHRPLRVPSAASVKYVDRLESPELRRHYPELARDALVDVDIVDDGESLLTQADGSLDFVIANHFIEHTEDPLGTLANHLRVLRPGGILYMAVPNREKTFDAERQATTYAHILRDHTEGPEWSRLAHYEEWVRYVMHAPEEERSLWVDDLVEKKYSIHFHVWNPEEFRDVLERARQEILLPFEVADAQSNGDETVYVLRKV
jgi:predicted SAM-dependent methyltransferase